MFSFYKLVEALDQLHEEIGGDVGVPSSSGVSAAGSINPPESPCPGSKIKSKGKGKGEGHGKGKGPIGIPVKQKEETSNTDIPVVGEATKWQKMFPKLSAKAAKKLTPLSTEKGIKLVKRMTVIPAHAYGMAEGKEQ